MDLSQYTNRLHTPSVLPQAAAALVMGMLYVHDIKVRYSEVDSQGIVFNAHYLAYCDDTFESWFRACFADRLESVGIEVVVKRAIIEWHTAARLADAIELGMHLERVGRTSFEFRFEGSIQGTRAFVAQVTYVVVDRRTFEPQEIPDRLRCVLAGDSPRWELLARRTRALHDVD